ncbi:unnamed protein product [Brassica rapa subsp. narinosa]|uniref:Uncharacterized protein n=1 Tax=Brassica campestris TaxID=3711 RepID=M4EJC4_BRACM
MKVSSKSQKFKMGDAEIVQGVNCPIARWIYRGICMLAVVSWLIELALEPEFSSLSEPKQKESPGMLVLCSAPFLIYTVVVVRSFYLPVPTSFDLQADWRLLLSCFLAVMTVTMCAASTRRYVEVPILVFSATSGIYSALLLEWPVKDLCVQHVVYTYFAVALIGYLGYQRPVWPACLFVVALVIVNAFIFYGVLRLDLPKPPEPEEEERDYQDSPV